MKKILCGTFLIALLSSLSMGQNSTPTGNSAPQAQPASNSGQPGSMRLAPGTVIPVQLMKSIDAKKLKNGDEVDARIAEDLKSNSGEVVVPKDTKVIGHVTEAQARSKEQKESQLAIAFDHAVTKSGSDVAMPMSIQAVIAQSYLSAGNAGGEGADQAAPASNSGGMGPATSGGRNGGMGGAAAPPPNPSAGNIPSSSPQNGTPRQPINGNTQGVLGIPNLKLDSANSGQASVLTSDKNNVKLDSGTLILLRVNQ